MRRTKNKVGPNQELGRGRGEPPPLTRAQVLELDRRVRDSEDRTRYLLATALTAKHVLFYNVAEDTFVMGDPAGGTLFKRRQAAEAIRGLLRSRVKVIRCRVSLQGRLILRSVPRVRPVWLAPTRSGGVK